MQVKSKPR